MKTLICAGCGATLNERSCQLKCYKCGYNETCSDLLPALETNTSTPEPSPGDVSPKLKGWDEKLMYKIYRGRA